MKSRKEYEKVARAKLDEMEAEIDKLKAQVRDAREELIDDHKSKLDQLHELNKKSREAFDELVDAGEEAWKDAQRGLEHYWTALGNEIKAYQGFNDKHDKDKK